jgi:HEAT repeats
LVLAALLVFSGASPARAGIQVEAHRGLLNIQVSEPSSVDAVLQEIGRALGAKVEGGGCARQVGPLNLNQITFKQALENVAPDHSLIVERQGDTERVKRILLVEGAGQAPAQALQQETNMSLGDQQRNDEAIALRDIARLANANNPTARAQLDRLAKSHASITVRAAALGTLATFSSEGAGPFLVGQLTSERDPQSRLAAAQALTQIDFDLAKTAIGKAAAKESDIGMRQQLKAIVGE